MFITIVEIVHTYLSCRDVGSVVMWIYTSNYMSCEFIPTTRCCLATYHHFVSDGSHVTNNVQVVEVTASHPTQPAEAQNWPKMEDENVVIGDTRIWTTHQYTQQSKHIQTPFWTWDSFGVLCALGHPCPCCFDRGWASNPHTWVCKVRCSKKNWHRSCQIEMKKPWLAFPWQWDWGFATWKLLFQGTCRSCSKSIMQMVSLHWDCGHSLQAAAAQIFNILWLRLFVQLRPCLHLCSIGIWIVIRALFTWPVALWVQQ